jgi:hypothetical protein
MSKIYVKDTTNMSIYEVGDREAFRLAVMDTRDKLQQFLGGCDGYT